MVIAIYLAAVLFCLPIQLLDSHLWDYAGLAICIVLGPPVSYWIFGMFYPDRPEREQGPPESEPVTCLECHSIISSGEDICAKCGWTYKSRTRQPAE